MSLILNDPRPLLGDARDRFAGRAEAVRAALSEHKDVIARVADQAVRAAGRKGRPKLFGAAFLGFAAGVAVLGARKAAMQATTGLAGDWFAAWRLGVTPDGAESQQRFRQRGITAMNTALAHQGPVLVVAHPGIYAAFLEAAGMVETGDWLTEHAAAPIFHQPRHATRWHAETLAA